MQQIILILITRNRIITVLGQANLDSVIDEGKPQVNQELQL